MQHSNTDSCILLKFYIKPQRYVCTGFHDECCILLKFYIKPQRRLQRPMYRNVVSY